MKIVSWNVNGIRSVFKKNITEWFTKESPDILCLQETKANFDQFPSEINEFKNIQVYHSSAHKAGYSGVATFCKKNPLDTKKLDNEIFDSEGRTLIHEFENFFLLNCYFPNGQRDHKRVPYKLHYCEEILKKVLSLEKLKPVIITGDFNTAHHEIDLANPKTNLNTTGFLPIERQWLDLLTNSGFIDIYRHLHPQKHDAYTWWTYRNDCRKRNIGWRIDYFFISQNLVSKVSKTKILHDIQGSDHCPISIEIDL